MGTKAGGFLLKEALKEHEIEKLQEALGEFDLRWEEDRLFLFVSVWNRRRAKKILREGNFLKGGEEEAPRGLAKYRQRYGILLGAFFFLFLLLISGTRIWNIEIQGNELLQEGEILEMLAEEGLRLGADGNRSFQEIAANCLSKHPSLSWMSLGRHGTTVTCVVMETKNAAQADQGADGANLRATKDATVLQVNVSRGRVMVSKGQTVKKGELLASGVIKGGQGTFFLEAKGSVIGQVTEVFTEKIPLEVLRKNYTAAESAEKEIIFFGIPIKIWKNSRNSPSKYDTIEVNEPLVLFGRPLPVFFKQSIRMPYTAAVEKITEEDAKRSALSILGEKIYSQTKGGEILEKSTAFRVENGFLIAECTVTYTCMIAESVPFSLESPEKLR